MKVRFSEVVIVFELPRRCSDELEMLFWTVEDYQRMRVEHQTQLTRRARVRIREMKRRMVARIQQFDDDDDDDANAKSLHSVDEFSQQNSARLEVEPKPMKNPCTAFAA
jgi:hypothetical protein